MSLHHAFRLLGEARAELRYERALFSGLGVRDFLRLSRIETAAWLKEMRTRRRYEELDADDIRATRKSDTVFVFGSGYSLHDVPEEMWKHIEQHDTLGFSGFIYASWVRVDYHLIRGWTEFREGGFAWEPSVRQFSGILNGNSRYNDTILLLQGERHGQFCNHLAGGQFIRQGTRIYRYKTARAKGPATRRLEDGLRHTSGTLCDTVNFAYAMGWKRIILVGVDLYDNRYFWLKPDETLAWDPVARLLAPSKVTHRGASYDSTHNTARLGIVDTMGAWREQFAKEGVELLVYNPRSLLTSVLPLYAPQAATSP
jgi:hypothetical protein